MPIPHVLAAAVLLTAGPMAARSQPVQQSTNVPMRVTTDTPEYCAALADQVVRAKRQKVNAPANVEELAAEGHHMCIAGLVRPGLMRLRRALMLLDREE